MHRITGEFTAPETNALKDQLLLPGKIERLVREERFPWIHRASNQGNEFYLVHLYPETATAAGRLEADEGGIVYFADEDDYDGTPCKTVVLTLEEGEILITRANLEAKKMYLETFPPYIRWWKSLVLTAQEEWETRNRHR